MNYQEALAYLEGLNIFGIKLGLTRIQRLLELLDVPQERYRTIHGSPDTEAKMPGKYSGISSCTAKSGLLETTPSV